MIHVNRYDIFSIIEESIVTYHPGNSSSQVLVVMIAVYADDSQDNLQTASWGFSSISTSVTLIELTRPACKSSLLLLSSVCTVYHIVYCEPYVSIHSKLFLFLAYPHPE